MSEKQEYTEYLSMLRKTQKYKDLYATFEGKLSIFLGSVVALLFSCFVSQRESIILDDFLRNISIAMIVGLFTLLGFILSGFAFVSGTISLRAARNIQLAGKTTSLDSIFFTFFFLGSVIGITILFYVAILLISFTTYVYIFWFSIVLTFLTSYLTLFVVFYSIGIFESCINVYKINQKYDVENFDSDENKK